ncbi:MAG: molybdopterin-dependent oxidoreductase [Actinomycetota bacterium]
MGQRRSAFLRGAGGMAAALLLVFGISSPLPLVANPALRIADLLIRVTPGGFATAMIETLGANAKRGLAVGVTLAAIVAGGLIGMWIDRAGTSAGKSRRALIAGAGVFAGSVLLTIGTQAAGSIMVALAYAASSFVFMKLAAGVPLLAAVEPKKVEGDETPLDAISRSRRSLFVRFAWLMGGVLAAGTFGRSWYQDRASKVPIVPAAKPFDPPPVDPDFPSVPGLAREITRTEDFYNIDINLVKPAVDHQSWRLKIGGLVGQPYELSYEQMQTEFEVVEMVHTLTCISNEVGGHLISTAVWRGVRLKDVLQRAQVDSGVVDLVFKGAEGYSDSIPLGKAVQDTTLLVFGMNGEALPKVHGFPARIIVPGIYGMKNVKWLTEIEAVDHDYQGYWMVRGWSDEARIKTASRIDTPQDVAFVPGGTKLAGVAWAGDRGIRRVEISEDRGATWTPAVLKRELGPLTWRLWATDLKRQQGKVRVMVRAVDGLGEVQSDRPERPHPSGSSGLHFIDINVE